MGALVAADGARREEQGFELQRGLLYQWLKNSWLVALLEAVAHWLLVWYLVKRRDHRKVQVLEESLPDLMPALQPGVSQGEGGSQGVPAQGNNQLGGREAASARPSQAAGRGWGGLSAGLVAGGGGCTASVCGATGCSPGSSLT